MSKKFKVILTLTTLFIAGILTINYVLYNNYKKEEMESLKDNYKHYYLDSMEKQVSLVERYAEDGISEKELEFLNELQSVVQNTYYTVGGQLAKVNDRLIHEYQSRYMSFVRTFDEVVESSVVKQNDLERLKKDYQDLEAFYAQIKKE